MSLTPQVPSFLSMYLLNNQENGRIQRVGQKAITPILIKQLHCISLGRPVRFQANRVCICCPLSFSLRDQINAFFITQKNKKKISFSILLKLIMKKIRDSRIVTDVKVYMIGMRAVTIFFNFLFLFYQLNMLFSY